MGNFENENRFLTLTSKFLCITNLLPGIFLLLILSTWKKDFSSIFIAA